MLVEEAQLARSLRLARVCRVPVPREEGCRVPACVWRFRAKNCETQAGSNASWMRF